MANLFDAANAREGEPDTIVIGDFVQWKKSNLVTDYPTSDYTVRYVARISGGGDNEIIVTGTGQTDHYLFTVLNDNTGNGNDLTVTGDVAFNGNIELGNAVTDTITTNAIITDEVLELRLDDN